MASEHKYLLPEPFDGTSDVMSYMTQFETLSSLQYWLKPVIDATTGNPVLDGSGNPTYTDKRHQIFPLRLRGSAIEFYQSLDNATKGNYTLLKAELQRQYLEPPEFFRSALTKRTQGSGEKVSEFLADLKLLASKAYPTGSVDVRNHVVLQAFLDGIFNPHVRIELRKQKPADIPAALEQAIHIDAVYRLENSALPVSTSTFVSGQIATRSRPTNRKKKTFDQLHLVITIVFLDQKIIEKRQVPVTIDVLLKTEDLHQIDVHNLAAQVRVALTVVRPVVFVSLARLFVAVVTAKVI